MSNLSIRSGIMRVRLVFLLLLGSVLYAQAPPFSANTVIASFDGKSVTYGQLSDFITAMAGMATPEMRAQMMRDLPSAVHKYFLWHHLAERATNEKLDQRSPTREQLYWDRVNILAQAELNYIANTITTSEDDLRQYYAANKDKYTQVKVTTIYIPFSTHAESASSSNTRVLGEEEAKTKIADILAQIRAGADFGSLAQEFSEEPSRAKDGGPKIFRNSDDVPELVRTAVFKLKQGEVTEPVRQPNGFYLFRAEAVEIRTFQDVQGEIAEIVRQENFKRWLDEMDKSIKVKIEKPAGSAQR